ncbi:hypothetical protein ABGB13_44990, partial [Nonomuraea sp. B10E8]
MEFFHAASRTQAIFDDEHVISYAGLAPALRLAERSGLDRLVGEHLALGAADGVNAPAKVVSIVAGMTWIVIDVDATLITAHSDKQGASATFKKGYGFHPLAAWCANTQE